MSTKVFVLTENEKHEGGVVALVSAQEWLVYIDEDYYPSAEVVTAETGPQAIAEAERRIGYAVGDAEDLDNRRPLLIAVPLKGHSTNRVDEQNAWRWDQLRDADR